MAHRTETSSLIWYPSSTKAALQRAIWNALKDTGSITLPDDELEVLINRFLGVFFLALVITPIANAGVIQGQFYCKEVFPDGSTDENIVEVTGEKMTRKNLVISFTAEYRQVHINKGKVYSVFANDQRVYFLAPKTDKTSWGLMAMTRRPNTRKRK